MEYYYNKTTIQNNTEYYNMGDTEYKRLTNHIITLFTTMLERGVLNGKREDYKNLSLRLEIMTADRYHRKSNLHNEPISMLDALCGIIAKINKRKNDDLTKRQIDMFNRIVEDFSKSVFGNKDVLENDTIQMIDVGDESTTDSTFGNGLFELN